jgi:hypothetical protein
MAAKRVPSPGDSVGEDLRDLAGYPRHKESRKASKAAEFNPDDCIQKPIAGSSWQFGSESAGLAPSITAYF